MADFGSASFYCLCYYVLMQKLYCYVDENGIETKGKIFIVAIVVVADENDKFMALCEELEKAAGKGRTKWRHTKHSQRIDYLRRVFRNKQFRGSLHFAVFRGKIAQHEATIEAIVRAVKFQAPTERYTTRVYVDALSKTQRHKYGAALRKRGIPTENVQGVEKDEHNALIRLADHVAGLVRDVYGNGNEELKRFCEEAQRKGVLIEV